MRLRFLAWCGLLCICSSAACQRQKPAEASAPVAQEKSGAPSASYATATAQPAIATNQPAATADTNKVLTLAEIPAFALTNEFGAPVRFRECEGTAVAMTFFFTRCPIPEYCPRLSRNFAEASRKLAGKSGGSTNWHLFSISFDPADTPAVLRDYARPYQYDSNHWSFVTGDPAHIRALAHGFGVALSEESGTFVHDFRTAVFDANGRFQTMWPIGGDTTDLLVQELTKATAVAPSRLAPRNQR